MGVNCSRALTLGRPSSQTCTASLDLTPANFTSAADVDDADLAAYGAPHLARLLYHPPARGARVIFSVCAPESAGLLLYALPHDANEDDCEVRRVAARRNASAAAGCVELPVPPQREERLSLVVGLPEAAAAT